MRQEDLQLIEEQMSNREYWEYRKLKAQACGLLTLIITSFIVFSLTRL